VFLSYLWGMETDSWYEISSTSLCSYPTYEEWKLISYSFSISSFTVLILPMRNGNKIEELLYEAGMWSSYPTYEEWKQIISGLFYCFLKWFLSYLWGMETIIKCVIFTSFSFVLILPMRNGNNWLWRFALAIGVFLSYLWGMETFKKVNY